MVLLAEKPKLLWLGEFPESLAPSVRERWDVFHVDSGAKAGRALHQACVVVVAPSEDDLDPRRLSAVLDELDCGGAVGLVLLPAGHPEASALAQRRGPFVFLPSDTPPDELAVRIETASALQPVIQQLRRDALAGRSFGAGMARSFEEFDEEMRLAARLQRDFLPRSLPQVGGMKFAAMFRPAGWVSGDIYDVFRLDETRVGFYIADVVGHGMPAALLTMFIKRALQTKRIVDNSYEIIPPEQAIAQLNTDICRQDLSSCQFCTAFYGVVDVHSRVLRYARAGHPSPFLLRADGETSRLAARGALLGIFPGEQFEARQVQLGAGDRVVVFSDGAEELLHSPEGVESPLLEELRRLRQLPAEDMALQLAMRIDHDRLSDSRDDDVTVLVLDVRPE